MTAVTATAAPLGPSVFWRPSAALRVAHEPTKKRSLAAICALTLLLGLAGPVSAATAPDSESGVAAQTDLSATGVGADTPASPVSVGVEGSAGYDGSLGCCVAPNGPARFIDAGGTMIDRSSIRTTISSQRQGRHVLGDRNYNGGSYFSSADDAQRVLDDFHSGSAEILGIKGNDIVLRTDSVTGFNHNPGAGFPNQPTNVFFIKGSSSPSVVPYNPTWGS